MKRVRFFPAVTLFLLGAATAEMLLNLYTGEVFTRPGYVAAVMLFAVIAGVVFVGLVSDGW